MGRESPPDGEDFPFGAATVRVFVVHGDAIARAGVVHILEGAQEFVVVGQAATARVALGGILTLRPDLVITDAVLPASDGIALIQDVRSRIDGITCLVLSTSQDTGVLRRARAAGAVACMLMNTSAAELVRVCLAVARGQAPPLLEGEVTPGVGLAVHDQLLAALPNHLTLQERRILLLLADGRTNREISQSLYLSERTVRNYVSHVLGKLGVANRTQAATFVTRVAEDLRGRQTFAEPT